MKKKIITILFIMWWGIFSFFGLNTTFAKDTIYKVPTWDDIKATATNTNWDITWNWYIYATSTNAKQYCVELWWIYKKYTSATLNNTTDIATYNKNWLTWEKKRNKKVINDVICDIPEQTASGSVIVNIDNGWNTQVFTQQDIKDIYLVEFVILLLIMIIRFLEGIVWRKFDIKLF